MYEFSVTHKQINIAINVVQSSRSKVVNVQCIQKEHTFLIGFFDRFDASICVCAQYFNERRFVSSCSLQNVYTTKHCISLSRVMSTQTPQSISKVLQMNLGLSARWHWIGGSPRRCITTVYTITNYHRERVVVKDPVRHKAASH